MHNRHSPAARVPVLFLLVACAGGPGRSGSGIQETRPDSHEGTSEEAPSQSGSDGQDSLDGTVDRWALDLGPFSFSEVGPVGVGFHETDAGRCEVPDTVAFAGYSTESNDSIEASLRFYGGAEGDYSIDGSVEGMSDGNAINWEESSLALHVGGELWWATSGTMSFVMNSAHDEGTVIFSGVVLKSFETGAMVSVDGEYTTPLLVGCAVLPPVDKDPSCGWVTDPAPYATEFCRAATADFPDWTWL